MTINMHIRQHSNGTFTIKEQAGSIKKPRFVCKGYLFEVSTARGAKINEDALTAFMLRWASENGYHLTSLEGRYYTPAKTQKPPKAPKSTQPVQLSLFGDESPK